MTKLEKIPKRRFTLDTMLIAIRSAIALIRNTFVTSCPRCHSWFFGFHAHGVQMRLDGVHYRIVCHKCANEHKQIDKIG